jgi:AcrR family transcriptional regulator
MRENIWSVDTCTCTLVNVKAVTRERNPRGQGERLRSDLVEAAVDLIAENRSIDGVSLRGAAKRAGVSPMAVYNHFEDKDALVEAAIQQCWNDFQVVIAEALEVDDPVARLRAAGDAYVRFGLAKPGQYAVMFTGGQTLPPHLVGIGLSSFDVLVQMVQDILDLNGDDRDALFVAAEVHTWIHGIVLLDGCVPNQVDWPSTDRLLDELMTRLGLTST